MYNSNSIYRGKILVNNLEEDDIIKNIQTKRRFNAKISRIISDTTGVAETDFNSNTLLKSIKNVDELDILDIILDVEKDFNIKLDDNIYDSIKTVGDIYDVVRCITGGKNRSLN